MFFKYIFRAIFVFIFIVYYTFSAQAMLKNNVFSKMKLHKNKQLTLFKSAKNLSVLACWKKHIHPGLHNDFSCFGNIASKMSPYEFVHYLHEHNLSVKDSIDIHITQKRKEAKQEFLQNIIELGIKKNEKEVQEFLNKDDQAIRQLKLNRSIKHLFSSPKCIVTFDGVESPLIQSMVLHAVKKNNITGKMLVQFKNDPSFWAKAVICGKYTSGYFIGTLKNYEQILELNERFKEFFAGNNPTKNIVTIEQTQLKDTLYCNPCDILDPVLSHENIHFKNCHTFEKYRYAKSLDVKINHPVLLPIQKLHEYEADILPTTCYKMACKMYNFLKYFRNAKEDGLYLSCIKGPELVGKIIALHKAEQNLI